MVGGTILVVMLFYKGRALKFAIRLYVEVPRRTGKNFGDTTMKLALKMLPTYLQN